MGTNSQNGRVLICIICPAIEQRRWFDIQVRELLTKGHPELHTQLSQLAKYPHPKMKALEQQVLQHFSSGELLGGYMLAALSIDVLGYVCCAVDMC